MRSNAKWYEILVTTMPRYIRSVVGIVLTPTTLELNVFSSSIKLLSECSNRFHILFTAHVDGELISWFAIGIDFHNIICSSFAYRYILPQFSANVHIKMLKKRILSEKDTKHGRKRYNFPGGKSGGLKKTNLEEFELPCTLAFSSHGCSVHAWLEHKHQRRMPFLEKPFSKSPNRHDLEQ